MPVVLGLNSQEFGEPRPVFVMIATAAAATALGVHVVRDSLPQFLALSPRHASPVALRCGLPS